MRKCSQLEDHLGYWMRFVSNHVSSSFEKKLAAHNIGVGEWVVLRHLYDQEFLSPGTLAERTGMTRGAMSKLVDKLLHKNLVERMESPHDRRFQEVKITPEGRKLLPLLAKLADQNDQEFFHSLSDTQRHDLIQLLKNLVSQHKWNTIPTQ